MLSTKSAIRKTDFTLLVDVFGNFIKVSTKEYATNPLCCVSICSYTYQCVIKDTGIKLQTLQDKVKILLLDKKFRRGIGSFMGDVYVKSDKNK